jgi:predicted outer membrane repeat protein
MYVINVQKSPDYRIFVNEKSPALPGQENGNSWQSAYKCLQKAIDKAEKEGKEIWVAEGTYYPVYKTNQNDPRSAAFLIKPGIEIIGGFNGDETGRKPKGSPYLTILSGDLSKNDQNIKSWPPSANDLQHMNDNVYRVMMTDGNPGSGGIRIEGLTIRGGVANGTGSNNSGAGIHNTERIPTIVNCAIIRNFSLSDGAGIYTNAASITIENSVIRDNVSLQGNGAGLFLNDAGYALINHTAFANNIAGTDSAHASRGGALYLNSSNVTLSTCVFVKNSAAGNGGSIYNNSGMLSVLYSTNVNNASIKGTGGIVNRDSSSSAIIHNSILWNNLKNGYGELSGSKFTVNYSCVTNGYQGTGNISDDPRFVDVDLPAGDDGKFATYDDGLKLKQDSPCRYSADTVGFETDFVGFDRPVGDRYDMGAYESLPIQPTTDVLGRFVYGVFTVAEDIPVFTNLSIEAAGNPHTLQRRIHIVANGAHARVVRAKVQKHKKTRVSSFEAEVTALDANMNRIPGAVTTKVRLYRAGEEGGNYLFWSLTPDRTKGKPIIFSNNYSIVGDNPDATILYNIPDGNIRVFVSKKQF